MPAQPHLGNSHHVGASSESTTVASSNGSQVTTPEEVSIQYPAIANPDIMAAAQVMRDVSITSNATLTVTELGNIPYVPVMVPNTTETFRVSSQVDISTTRLVGTSFTLDITAKDSRSIPLDRKFKEINHNLHLKRYLTVTVPPLISTSLGEDGTVYVSVTQQDPVATLVKLYYRIISITGGTSYREIQEINIRKQDGVKIEELGIPIEGTSIVRAVPFCQNRSSGLFTDVIVRPFTSRKQTTSEDLIHGVLQSYNNETGIFVKATNIVGIASFACLTRKNISAGERKFKILTDFKHVNNSTVQIDYQDEAVQLNDSYEYKLLFLTPDGNKVFSKHSSRTKKVQTFPTPDIVTGRFVTTPPNKRGQFGVRFNMGVSSTQKSPESIIFQALRKSGLASDYKDDIKDAKSMRKKLYYFHVIRKNTTTGQEDDFGFYPMGTFSDTGGKKKKIDMPHRAFAYEYHIELICKDPEQIIEELKNTRAIRQKKSYQNSPNIGKAQTAEKSKFKANNQSKFFSSQALVHSTISTGPAIIRNHANGSLGFGKTGNIKIIPVAIPQANKIKIVSTGVSSNEFGDVTLSWRTQGKASVDHFIIRASRSGYVYPCGVCHHTKTDSKNFIFVDRTQKTVPGVITYTITPVMLDFTQGETVKAGQVAVVGD